ESIPELPAAHAAACAHVQPRCPPSPEDSSGSNWPRRASYLAGNTAPERPDISPATQPGRFQAVRGPLARRLRGETRWRVCPLILTHASAAAIAATLLATPTGERPH